MIQLGCIADDLTGATDLASLLVRAGWRVVQVRGIPESSEFLSDYDAVVIALKSRSIPATDAVQQSLAALKFLQSLSAKQFYFKYCSTFDSTPEGNIGPVAQALSKHLASEKVLFCPAFPENGRTVYSGHLFVHNTPLHESGMEKHPLNPMTDSNLMRVLSSQTVLSVGLVPWQCIQAGTQAIQESINSQSHCFLIADALNADDLSTLAQATSTHQLSTGGSAFAGAIAQQSPSMFRQIAQHSTSSSWHIQQPAAVLVGSCSRQTFRQVEAFKPFADCWRMPLLEDAQLSRSISHIEQHVAASFLNFLQQRADSGSLRPMLIYSAQTPDDVITLQTLLGNQAAGELVERILAGIAHMLKDAGQRLFIVAGGETSGAITHALNVPHLEIGPEIAAGVPWTRSITTSPDNPAIYLALKSGNFGQDNFFSHAIDLLTSKTTS